MTKPLPAFERSRQKLARRLRADLGSKTIDELWMMLADEHLRHLSALEVHRLDQDLHIAELDDSYRDAFEAGRTAAHSSEGSKGGNKRQARARIDKMLAYMHWASSMDGSLSAPMAAEQLSKLYAYDLSTLKRWVREWKKRVRPDV